MGGWQRDSAQQPAPQPHVTCPQGAVGPVEKEHRIAAHTPQRLIRRSPDVVKVAFLAVIIQQGLRERRPRFTRANASPRDGRRPRRASRTGLLRPFALHRPPLRLAALPPPGPSPCAAPRPRRSPGRDGARRQRQPVAARHPSLLPSAAEGALRKGEGEPGRTLPLAG